ncbi:MAG: TIGR01212 family radical SAM protein [Candidatus Cloacimonetes bacterium]|nr:TIGR01212 family radical SAM protein [Candidatus Cloacimonadota bacterium]MBT7470098.1 TIGR01212 family radical SAM protein [Candidatus Cloacimonadota bacterium]
MKFGSEERKLENKIFTYSQYLKTKFGKKVFRVGLSLGKICPHRLKNNGCVFCNPETFTGEYQSQNLSIKAQLENAIPRIKRACGDVALLAYFQDETSTAGSLDFLKVKFKQALSHPEIIGLVISTRPDFVNLEILELLKSFQVPLTIEIGLQSIHDKSLKLLNRGHTFEQAEKTIQQCGENGLDVGVHLIMGIPGESFADMKKTVQWISANKFIKQVKFHNLVVYKNTKLAEMNLPILTIDEYIEALANLLPHLRKDIVVTRLFTSNVRKNQLAVDNITGNKTKWMAKLRDYLYENELEQGKDFR